jgi:hypothetical protein
MGIFVTQLESINGDQNAHFLGSFCREFASTVLNYFTRVHKFRQPHYFINMYFSEIVYIFPL